MTLLTTGLEKVVFGEEKMEQFEKGAHSKLRAGVGSIGRRHLFDHAQAEEREERIGLRE